jgi:hypothetical protein
MKLKFCEQLIEPAVRRLHALHVAFDSAWFEEVADRDAYYMYGDLALTPADRETITRHQLRYDITIIPPLAMGLEFVKTYGHYHPACTLSCATRTLSCTRCSRVMPIIFCSVRKTKSGSMRLFWSRPREATKCSYRRTTDT